MRPIRANVLLIPRIGHKSLLCSPRSAQWHCFHTASVLRLPNPYSKRPTELPQPVDKLPDPPPIHPEHGLYGFFRNKISVTAPKILENHGTATLY